MFKVMRCCNDGYEVWKTEVAVFPTESEAAVWAEDEEGDDASGVWYEVKEW